MRITTTVQLNSPILQPGALRRELERLVAETASDIERDVKERMRAPKHGRTYRRGAITKRATKGTRGLGLREVVRNRAQMSPEGFSLERRLAVVGYKFHRASAAGEAPAIDHAGVINSILTKPDGTRATITANNVAALLEYHMNRPAFEPALEDARPGFVQRVDETIRRLCDG